MKEADEFVKLVEYSGRDKESLVTECIEKDRAIEELTKKLDHAKSQLDRILNTDGKKILNNTVSYALDSIMADIMQNAICNSNDLFKRIRDEANWGVLNHEVAWQIARDWHEDLGNLDTNAWKKVCYADDLISVIANQIVEFELYVALLQEMSAQFGTDDYEKFLGTFQKCDNCNSFFSPVLENGLTENETMDGFPVCERCKRLYYDVCTRCWLWFRSGKDHFCDYCEEEEGA